MDARLLRTDEAAELLGLSKATLCKLRHTGRGGPKYLKLGRRVVYDQRDLREWLEANRRSNTSQPSKCRGETSP